MWFTGLISGAKISMFSWILSLLEILTTKIFRHSTEWNLSGEMVLLRPIYIVIVLKNISAKSFHHSIHKNFAPRN